MDATASLHFNNIQEARGESESLQFKLNTRHVELCLRNVEVIPDVRPEGVA